MAYYRRYVHNFTDIAAPLHELAKGGREVCWTPAAQQAFHALKTHLSTSPILALPNFMIPFTVYTNASDSGLGAVLSQRVGSSEYVVCYMLVGH
jgi:hypothetical protein